MLPHKRLRLRQLTLDEVDSRLRHVDARQEWVQALRDSKLVKAVHVDTTENLSDLFTKALDLGTFIGFRKQLMHFHALPVVTH